MILYILRMVGLKILRMVLYLKPECFDTTVCASKRCLLHDIQDTEKLTEIVEELVLQLLWAFNIATDDPRKREQIRKRII